MRCSLSGPLAAALLLSVASVPCPAGWLDDTTHNVGVEDILAPIGTVDSGQTIIPRCVVANFGTAPESLWTFFAIDDGTPGGYSDSLWLTGLAPAERETVAFPNWVPRGRDSMSVTAWTRCEGDTFPLDDTARGRFLVRIKDIAITQITMPPPDTVVDSGAMFYPQGRVWNYGNISLNFDVQFTIGAYHSTRNLNLIAGGATLATAPDPYMAVPGIWACRVFALMPGDLHPENNTMIDTFTVRREIRDSLWVRVLMPDTVDTGVIITPLVRAGNCGDFEMWFWLRFSISDSAGPEWYTESTQVILGPGDSIDLEFPPMVFFEPGVYLAVDWVWWGVEDYPADSLFFRVVPGSGVEESQLQASSRKLQATVMRRLPAGSVAFDAMGRRVLNPKSGILFIQERSALHVRKVVLQR